MIFSLDLRRAAKGDCFLLHSGTRARPGLALIDGGPRGVYGAHLKPRLTQIRTARGLAAHRPLPLDLLMVSHVDDDHIQGILDLTREMIAAADKHQPQALQVMSFWHNGFDSILGNAPKELTAALRRQRATASVAGEAADDLDVDPEGALDREMLVSSLKVLASIEQGSRLRGEAERLGFPCNPEFDGKLIVARPKAKAVTVARGLKVTVIGPMLPEIRKLHEKHEAWLRDLKAKGKTPAAALAAYVDASVPNLSSIVVLAEGGGRRMLLTGDARGDKILEGLETAGLLQPGGTLAIDLLKVPHHGSARNLDDDFFERITADHYVLSGDGEHGNPDREALEMLVKARGTKGYAIHLTYPVAEIDAGRKADWIKERAKEQARKAKNPKAKVRAAWSPARHGLQAFIDGQPGLDKTLRVIADPARSHVIDLADPLAKSWPELA